MWSKNPHWKPCNLSSFGLNAGSAVNPARDFSPRLFTLIAGWEDSFSVFLIILVNFLISIVKCPIITIEILIKMFQMMAGGWPLVLDPTHSAAHRRRPRCRHLRHHDQRSPPGGIKPRHTIHAIAYNPRDQRWLQQEPSKIRKFTGTAKPVSVHKKC